MFTIQQAADQLGVSTKTLRQWEADGLLPFDVSRTRGGHRRYEREQIMQLKALLASHAGQIPRQDLDVPAILGSPELWRQRHLSNHSGSDQLWWDELQQRRERRAEQVQRRFLESVATHWQGRPLDVFNEKPHDNPLRDGLPNDPVAIGYLDKFGQPRTLKAKIVDAYLRPRRRRMGRYRRNTRYLMLLSRLALHAGFVGLVAIYAVGASGDRGQLFAQILAGGMLLWLWIRLRVSRAGSDSVQVQYTTRLQGMAASREALQVAMRRSELHGSMPPARSHKIQ